MKTYILVLSLLTTVTLSALAAQVGTASCSNKVFPIQGQSTRVWACKATASQGNATNCNEACVIEKKKDSGEVRSFEIWTCKGSSFNGNEFYWNTKALDFNWSSKSDRNCGYRGDGPCHGPEQSEIYFGSKTGILKYGYSNYDDDNKPTLEFQSYVCELEKQ